MILLNCRQINLKLFPLVIFLTVFFSTHSIYGATIKIIPDFKNLSIVIEGPIVKGDYDRFMKAVKKCEGYVSEVYLYTPGGDFFEAMKLGRAMKRMRMTTSAPKSGEDSGTALFFLLRNGYLSDKSNCICASAGFFIFAGGIGRYGQEIYVHRPYLTKETLATLDAKQAENLSQELKVTSQAYLKEMEVPQSIIDRLWSTSGDSISKITEDEAKTYFDKLIPEYEDWIKAKSDKNGNYDGVLEALQKEAYIKTFGREPDASLRKALNETLSAKNYQYEVWLSAKRFLGLTSWEVLKICMDENLSISARNRNENDRMLLGYQVSVDLIYNNDIVSKVYLDASRENTQIQNKVYDLLKEKLGPGEFDSMGLSSQNRNHWDEWTLDDGKVRASLYTGLHNEKMQLTYEKNEINPDPTIQVADEGNKTAEDIPLQIESWADCSEIGKRVIDLPKDELTEFTESKEEGNHYFLRMPNVHKGISGRIFFLNSDLGNNAKIKAMRTFVFNPDIDTLNRLVAYLDNNIPGMPIHFENLKYHRVWLDKKQKRQWHLSYNIDNGLSCPQIELEVYLWEPPQKANDKISNDIEKALSK